MPEFRCPACNRLLRTPDHTAGRSINCPRCQAPMIVPTPPPVETAEPLPNPFMPLGQLPAPAPLPEWVEQPPPVRLPVPVPQPPPQEVPAPAAPMVALTHCMRCNKKLRFRFLCGRCGMVLCSEICERQHYKAMHAEADARMRQAQREIDLLASMRPEPPSESVRELRAIRRHMDRDHNTRMIASVIAFLIVFSCCGSWLFISATAHQRRAEQQERLPGRP